MKPNTRTWKKIGVCMSMVLIVSACKTPTATSESEILPFEQAVFIATDGMVSQTKHMSGFLAKLETKLNRHQIVIDPVLDALSGQQTTITRIFEQKISERLQTTHTQFEILPFQPGNLGKAQYLLTGTMGRIQEEGGARGAFQINLALTDLKTGMVIAQSSSRARDDGFDTNPTPYYRDSPIQVKDKVVDGYIQTSKTPPGHEADETYFKRVPAATVVNAATVAYNNEHYQDALDLYKNALSTPAGEQLRVLNGIYLANWKLGRVGEAEQSFGNVVAYGLANNTLGVKFLFNPGTTQFWSDPKVGGAYGFWLRQIARQAASSKVCMNVIGHTSRTGTEQYNDQLSRERAGFIKQKLEGEVPELVSRLRASGMGFRQNMVGTGSDDARDALDRRVEFKVVNCG